jgi:hypothetical protein
MVRCSETERDVVQVSRRGVGVVYPVWRVNEKLRSEALVVVPRGWRNVMEVVDRGTKSRCISPMRRFSDLTRLVFFCD